MPYGPVLEKPICQVATVTCRAPIDVPVRTSFGVMHDRPTVFVRVTDADGLHGYGEVWCNFPSAGAEHRHRLTQELVGPSLMQLAPMEHGSVFDVLMAKLHILAIQSGEWGPLRQISAGLDAAVHDLAARRAGLPLYKFLNDESNGTLKAYASGIGPENPAAMASQASLSASFWPYPPLSHRKKPLKNSVSGLRKRANGEACSPQCSPRWRSEFLN